MNAVVSSPSPRRHVWRWVLVGLGVCLMPFVLLGLVVVSCLSLNRDAAALRGQVMDATHGGWKTKVQLNVGETIIGAVRTGMIFAPGPHAQEARLALASIRRASVGVYAHTRHEGDWSQTGLLNAADRLMVGRGWVRVVGVADHQDTVMIYVPAGLGDGEPLDVCLAVVNARNLVVVSTRLDPDRLAELVAHVMPKELSPHGHGGKFSL